MNSLLPPGSTPLELSLEKTVAKTFELPVAVRELWNPDTCPLDFLPWLAWSYGVNKWNTHWSETQKRGAVRNALFVKRYKGTYAAVESALNALGYSLRVVEWWQESPKADPYTFRIDIVIVDTGIDEPMYDTIQQIVSDTKNLRSHLSNIRLIHESSGFMAVGAVCYSGEVVHVDYREDVALETDGEFFVAAAVLTETNLYTGL